MTETALNLIGGQWTGSPDFERRNPARAAEVAVSYTHLTLPTILLV